MRTGLEAQRLEPFRHGNPIKIRLRLDHKGQSPSSRGSGGGIGDADAEALPELGELTLDLGGGKVGRHCTHSLRDPADYALAELLPAEGVAVLVQHLDADRCLLC